MFLAGLTDSYNPCSIGVLLVSLTILVGLGKKNLIAIFGFSYLTIIFITYFLIGLGFLKAFHLFGVHGFFGYAAGIVLIVVGLAHLLPRSFGQAPIINFLNRCHIPTNLNQHLDKGVFIAGIISGFLIGLCTVPCAGGIYLGAIGLLATNINYWHGVLAIFIFNLGFILPLAIIFFLATRPSILAKIKKFNNSLAKYGVWATSILMILMGIILLLIAKL